MSQPFRLDSGGLIDRSRVIRFRFDERRLEGHPGDTLASALLANGVHLVGRSFKYHRPRGIFSAGAEEPNALVQVGRGARTTPNLRATQVDLVDGLIADPQNCWPTAGFDIGVLNNGLSRIFPAGFYYKTFMWPASLWMTYERFIRRAAGLGEAPEAPDPDHYDKTYAHCDVLVVGGGPAGLMAAKAAGEAGARVILAEDQGSLGGTLLATQAEIDGRAALDWVAETEAALAAMTEIRVLKRTTTYAYYDHNYLTLVERLTDHMAEPPAELPRQRLWKVRAKQVVLATGSIERPLVFHHNDRPGIMLANAAQAYANRFAVRPGKRAVVFTNNDSAYDAAVDLADAGVEIAAIVDLRRQGFGPAVERARARDLTIHSGHAIVDTVGSKRVSRVHLGQLSEDGKRIAVEIQAIDCDLVAVSGGWSPTVHLFSQSRGALKFDPAGGCFVPDTSAQAERSAGASAGTFGLAGCLAQGAAAGRAAAADAGFERAGADAPTPEATDEGPGTVRTLWLVPGVKPPEQSKQFVDLQNDVKASDLRLALREGYRSVEHVKRYTTTGMGTDQGKTANVNAIGIVAEAAGLPIPDVGVTTFRPPYTPVTFGVFAGRDVGDLLEPVRTTPMHAWHLQAGADFEDVGQWKRPYCYPREGEDRHRAVRREVEAVRQSLGLLDASTLGKIDVQGPDAAEFLNRVYTNAWLKLGIGRCRYGLMLNEAGMVTDDGVTSRIGETHFHMTTTTGGASSVLGHLEEYLQTEWPDLKVYLTSVTEQWAVASLSGPNARRLMAELTDDIDLDPTAFPFMSVRKGTVAGIPARVFRISFTGELSYEINVPSCCGLALWQALMTAGQKYDITAYGTEAMHVLRAEKGFIIVGQDTDGSVTPYDLGMDWIVSRTKGDFIGKRGLARPDLQKEDRKQLVGLLTENPEEVIPEGAHIVEHVWPQPPMTMLGHVTSSYYSPACGRSIALALIKGGRALAGQKLNISLPDRTIACTVAEPRFFDPEGSRLDG